MTSPVRDVVTGGILLAFGLCLFFVFVPIAVPVPESLPARAIAPDLWPKTTSFLIAFFGLFILGRGLVDARVFKAPADSAAEAPPSLVERIRLPLAIGGFFAYWGLIPLVGLPVSSVGAFVLYAVLLGERRPAVVAAVAVATSAGLFYFFTEIASIPIPLGMLFED